MHGLAVKPPAHTYQHLLSRRTGSRAGARSVTLTDNDAAPTTTTTTTTSSGSSSAQAVEAEWIERVFREEHANDQVMCCNLI